MADCSSYLVRFVHLYDEGQCHVVGIGKLVGQRGPQLVMGHPQSVPACRRRAAHHGRHFWYEAVQIGGVDVGGRVAGGQREDDT